MKRKVYVNDFVRELDRQNLIPSFEEWHERVHPNMGNGYLLIQKIVDDYPGGREQAYEDLKIGVRFWETKRKQS
jgi:hypothetical protein